MPDLFTAAQREEQRREPESRIDPDFWQKFAQASQQPEVQSVTQLTSQTEGVTEGQKTSTPQGLITPDQKSGGESPAPDFWEQLAAASATGSTSSVSGMAPAEIEESAARIERLTRKREAEAVEVDRSAAGEIGASVVRGALGIAKLPFQVAKIVGSDVLGSETVKKATVPIIESLEETAESPEWKPSKWAGGKPIDLDRLISNPGKVIGQITSQISNPRFWASQLPEGAMSMIPALVGAWAPRAVAVAGKLGTALEAAKVAGDTAKIAEIGRKLNRLSTIGMFGASMAMEAGQAEEKVREYELRHPDKPIPWGNRVVSIIGTGVVAGGLEALSFGRVFLGKYGGQVSLQEMVKQVMNGKGGGLLARKVIDSVATEGVTEGAQSFVENAFAKHGYDVDQKLTEGIVESILIGAALGGVGGTFTGLNVRGKAVREAGARVLETKRLAEEEYQSTLQAAEEGAARGEVLEGMPGPQEVAPPEPAVAPAMERQALQPTAPTPEEQHQAIFGNRFAENLPRTDAIRALVPEMGSHERAERFYDLYEQEDAATALKEFPELSAWATPAQREAARGLPPAFGGRPGQRTAGETPAPQTPMGVTGAEVAERATIAPKETDLPGAGTETGPSAKAAPALPAAPMGVAGAAAEDLATAQHRGEVGGREVVEEALGPIREQQALREQVLDQAGGAVPETRLRRMAAQEVEARLTRGEEVEPEVLAKFPELAAKYGAEVPATAAAPVPPETAPEASQAVPPPAEIVPEAPVVPEAQVIPEVSEVPIVPEVPPTVPPAAAKIKKKPTYNVGRAVERNDAATLIRAYGGFDPNSEMIKNFAPEEQGRIRLFSKKGAQGADALLDDLRSAYPHIFPYETEAEMFAAIANKDIYKTIDIDKLAKDQEAYYEEIARQAATEGLDQEGLAAVEADVAREFDAERDSIQSEGSAGEDWWEAALEKAQGSEKPTPKYSLKQAAFGLKSPQKLSRFEKRLQEVLSAYPEIDAEKVSLILRANPDTPSQDVALLSRLSPEELTQLNRGNLAATEREQLFRKATDLGQQKGLPGLGKGGLFKITEPPAIAQARQALAQDRGVAPEHLKYKGDWEIEDAPELGLHLFDIVDPAHPQYKSTVGWPISPEGESGKHRQGQGPSGGPLAAPDIQKAFGTKAQVSASTLMADVHEVLLPNGTRILVRQNAVIQVAPESLAAYGKKELEAEDFLAGEWRSFNGTNLISLAKGEGATTINHEVLHAAMELALTKRERQAVLKEYGDEEAAARAYENWNPEAKPDTLFQKILDFFRRLVEVFRPTAKGTFGKIKGGEVWGRKAKGTQVEGQQRLSIRHAEAEATLEQYHQEVMAADPANKSLWRRFWDGDPGLKESWTEFREKVYDQVVDRYAPGERAQEKLAKAGIVMPAGERFTSTVAFHRGQEGWNHEAVLGTGVYHDPVETTGAGDSFFSGATPTRAGDSLFKRVDPIRDLAQAREVKNKEVFRDLNLLMVANKDLELSGEVGIREPEEIKGTRPEESKAVLQALEAKYGDDLKILQRVGGKWNADGTFTPGLIQEWADQAILQRLLQGGIISQELYNKIKAQNQAYIPFMRLMDELDQYIGATGGGKVIKEIKGSERAILNPFQMLIELSAKANYAYARNRMIRSLYQMGQASPEMGITELKSKIVPGIPKAGTSPLLGLPTQEKTWAWSQLPPEKGAIPFYKDGKQGWLKLPPDLYQMTKNLMPEDVGLLMRVLKWPADVLRTGAVTTPEFGLVKNPIRDLIQAWLFNRAGFSPIKWGRDLYLSLSHDPDTMKMRAEAAAGGGFMATLAQSTVEENITAADIEGKHKKIWYASHPVEALRTLSAYLENLTRFSLYKQARENGLSHAEAIHEARRTTLDFRRLGAHPVARYLNMIIPFWNANIQGIDKLVTELQGPNRAAVWRRIGVLSAASIGLALLFHDDDRIKELEDWEKNYFWHIPLGKDGPIIRLPKPFEAGILFGSVPERLVEIAKGDNTTGLQAALKAAGDALTPEMIPAILRPLVELKSNYNFFLGRPIEDVSLQNLPVEMRAKPWTTELARTISGYGGNLIGLSPVKVEHFVRSFSGGLGANYYFPAADVALRKLGILEDLPNPQQEVIEKVFGIRAFFAKPPTGYRAKTVGDFFDNYQQVVQGDQGWKLLWNTGSMDKLDKFLTDNPEAMFARVARKQMAELGKIKKERNTIYLSKTLDAATKKTRLDALDEKVVMIARAGNALMDPEVAAAVKMPSRFKSDAFGGRKSLDLDGYYKFVAESLGDAYEGIQKELPRLLRMDDASRQRYLIKTIRQARAEYQPLLKKPEDVLKPYRFQNLLDKPTRKERAAWQSMFGVRKIPPGAASGYRLKEEEKEMRP